MFAGCLNEDGIEAMFSIEYTSFGVLICFISITGSVHKDSMPL